MAFDSPIPDFEMPGVLPLGEVDVSPSPAAAAPTAPQFEQAFVRLHVRQAPKEKPGSWIDWDAKARPAKELIDEFWKSYEAELERDPQSGCCCSEVPADKACSSSGK